MKKLAVTQGEWKIEERGCRNTITSNNGGFIDIWGDGIAEVSNEEKEANTRLVFYSREMFEMLNKFLEEFEYDNATMYECELFYNAKQLLTKITK